MPRKDNYDSELCSCTHLYHIGKCQFCNCETRQLIKGKDEIKGMDGLPP